MKEKNEKTKKAIRKSFFEILKTNKNFSSIKITNITQLSRINRTTFYRYYNNVNDIIFEIQNEIMVAFYNDSNTIEILISNIFTYLKNHENELKILFSCNETFKRFHLFYDTMSSKINKISNLNNKQAKIMASSIIGGITIYYQDNIFKDLDELKEELSLLYNYMNNKSSKSEK